MVRWTVQDKRIIAKAQSQIVYEDDWLGNETSHVDGYRCKRCRRVFDLDILEVDHIIPKAKRGSDRPANLQLLCPTCNKKKGVKVRSAKTSSTKPKTARAKAKASVKSKRIRKTSTRTVRTKTAKSGTKKPIKRVTTKRMTRKK